MRLPCLLLLLSVLCFTGCTSLRVEPGPSRLAPGRGTILPPTEAPGAGTRGFWQQPEPELTPAADGLWLVGRFDHADGWLEGYPEFARTEVDYGRELGKRVAVRLRRAYERVFQINRQLSQAQVNQLMAQGLRYRLTGRLIRLGHEDREEEGFDYRYGYLVARYELERRSGGVMRVVREDQLRIETRLADRLQVRHLDLLLDRLADRIVADVVESTLTTLTWTPPTGAGDTRQARANGAPRPWALRELAAAAGYFM